MEMGNINREEIHADEEYRQLAGRIYDLDLKVYTALGSSLGRVFNEDRETSINSMVHYMLENVEKHVVRSEIALIGNMARTIEDHDIRKEMMIEYDAVLQELKRIALKSTDKTIIAKSRQGLSRLRMDRRFKNNHHLVICISRSHGCGGSQIGFSLADALKINYYDPEIFKTVLARLEAEQDGLPDITGYMPDEKEAGQAGAGVTYESKKIPFREKLRRLNRYHGLPARDAVFFNQSDLICEMARKEDFIIMGRCADVILENNNIPHISIFITAPLQRRVSRLMEENGKTYKETLHLVEKVDKAYSAYYHFYTGRKWGQASNYDICFNSSTYGIEGSVDFLLNMLIANGIVDPAHINRVLESHREI